MTKINDHSRKIRIPERKGKPPAKASGLPVKNTIRFYQKPVPVLIIIIILTVIAFLPVLKNEFMISWDDGVYITDNTIIRNLNVNAIRLMFTTPVNATYVPIPLLTFSIEYKLFGLNPVIYHLDNLILHILCVVLVFNVLRKLRLDVLYAAMGALVFSIHPMHVESVAWITERKDLLYSLFFLISLLFYIYYCTKDTRKAGWFLLSIVFFILSLFSKIQAVSLPLCIVLIDYFLNRRYNMRVILEKGPFFLLSLLFGIAGILILQKGGVLKSNEIYSLTERLLFGSYALSAYIIKFFAPFHLSVLYPLPIATGELLPLKYYLSPFFLAGLVIITVIKWRKSRPFLFGVLFFLFNIVFMLQIVSAGTAYLSDRFTYLPYLGFCFVTGRFIQDLSVRLKNKKTIIIFFFSLVLLLFMILTHERCKVWKNGETLWSDVINKYPNKNSRPYNNRAFYYRSMKIKDEGLHDYSMAIALNNKDTVSLMNRGNIYFDRNMNDSAYHDYVCALRLGYSNPLLYANVGALFVRKEMPDSAILFLNKAIAHDSTQKYFYNNRSVAFEMLGKYDEAIADMKKMLELEPDNDNVFSFIGIDYQKKGDFSESIRWFDKAIRVKPTEGKYWFMRSQSWLKIGEKAKAKEDALKASSLGVDVGKADSK